MWITRRVWISLLVNSYLGEVPAPFLIFFFHYNLVLGSTSPKLAEQMTKIQYQKMEDQEGLQSVSLTNKLVRLVNRKLSYE